jgi:hypothetical protein
MTSFRLDRLRKEGLVGCLDGIGVTSENYKHHLNNEWIKITPESDYPHYLEEFLLCDEFGHKYVGSTPFDFYDSEWWAFLPKFPMQTCITNDDWVKLALKDE